MQHRRLVFVDPYSRFQQLAPACARSLADHFGVDAGARHQNLYIDATFGGLHQGFNCQVVRHEIGIGDAQPVLRSVDRKQVHQPHALAAFIGRAFEHLCSLVANRGKRRKIIATMQNQAAGFHPVVHERCLHLRHHRAFDAVMQVTPVVSVLRIAGP